MNDFSFNTSSKSVLYAGDTTLINNIENLILEQNQLMESALEWFRANSLAVNNNGLVNIIFSTDYKIYNNVQPGKLLGNSFRR